MPVESAFIVRKTRGLAYLKNTPLMTTTSSVSSAVDRTFERPGGIYGGLEDLPVTTQTGHFRRMEWLDKLDRRRR